jgi:hypothetical protein
VILSPALATAGGQEQPDIKRAEAGTYGPPPELTPEELQTYRFDSQRESKLVVSELSMGQRFLMQKQRYETSALMARNLGFLRFNENLDDLDLIQDIVDARLIPQDDLQGWQALGVVLGDLFARELKLHWVQVEDELGVSRALQFGKSRNFVFPVTMLSKRAGFREAIDIRELYARVAAEVEHFKELDRLRGINPPEKNASTVP